MVALTRADQQGMALLMSLVLVLLLSLIGVSSMQSATLQEKLAGSVMRRNQSFQRAEAALRTGEGTVQRGAHRVLGCVGVPPCVPPNDADASWAAAGDGAYRVDSVGRASNAVNLPADTPVTLYRITAVGRVGHSRTVLESIYATFDGKILASQGDGRVETSTGDVMTSVDGAKNTGGNNGRRIMWRQIQ
ncbi:type IV pilus assembly protein PilX [Pseudomonas sp. ok272]|nr:type IV pilus assembly protein PilX [Pseudomonas sp. ok272]SFM95517.1 type IV pilus assembly protein PilX [Pseudomonas sp. ok602]